MCTNHGHFYVFEVSLKSDERNQRRLLQNIGGQKQTEGRTGIQYIHVRIDEKTEWGGTKEVMKLLKNSLFTNYLQIYKQINKTEQNTTEKKKLYTKESTHKLLLLDRKLEKSITGAGK